MTVDPGGTGPGGAEPRKKLQFDGPIGPWRSGRGLLLGIFALKTIVLFALLYLTLDLSPGADLRLYKALVTPLYFFEFTLVGAILTVVAFSKVTVTVVKKNVRR
jgi:hypothetical protein